jgi:hypothetical protein
MLKRQITNQNDPERRWVFKKIAVAEGLHPSGTGVPHGA